MTGYCEEAAALQLHPLWSHSSVFLSVDVDFPWVTGGFKDSLRR